MIWLVVVVGLLLLVFLHELGHFVVALAVGIKPRAFYVGFPPALAKVRLRGVEYAIGAIPLGGYVRIPGMHRPAARDFATFTSEALREDAALAPSVQRLRRRLEDEDFEGARAALPELRAALAQATLTPRARRSAERALREIDEGTGSDAYWRQRTWKRVAVIAAGPGMNVLVAFVIFLAVYATGALTITGTTKVAQVESGTPAAAAGLRPGDRVVAVDGRATKTFDRVSELIRASDGRPVTVTVERGGKRVVLGPERTIQSGGRWIWGFVPHERERTVTYSFGESARLAASDSWHIVTGTVGAIGGLVHSSGRSQLSGPVGIVRVSAQALRTGFSDYLQVVAFISMSLALLNLLPLLPLDGGHILFSLIEAVRRRALAREVYERVSVVGMALIFLIWVIALQNDLTHTLPR